MKNESGSSESAAVLAVFIMLVLAAVIYSVAIVVAIVVKLLLWTVLLAAIGAPIYLFIKQTRASREIEANLSKVLAQVDRQEPVEVIPALSTATVEWQESVLTRLESWGLEMRFVRDTEDGKIHTTVRVEPDRAIATVFLNGIELKSLIYSLKSYSLYGQNIDSQKQCPEAVRHVREWMRRRILPELEAAKARRESEFRRLAAEREEERRKRDEYKRKYLR